MRAKKVLSLGVVTLALFGCHGGSARAVPEAGVTTTTAATVVPAQQAPGVPMPDVPSLVDKVQPTVVNITTTHTVRARETNPFGLFDPFGLFGPRGRSRRPEGPGGDRVVRQQALGSGFLIDAQGHVITNAHVVAQADEVKVKLADEREFDATVKGRDPRLDLAVLELKGAKDLPAATMGVSDAVRVGEYVVAVGNPFGLGNTVTMGIVSAKSRAIGAGPYDDFIQTDASINPGNSGGPLFDMNGQVIGINTAIAAEGQGIGFAIPIDALKEVLPQLLTKGHVDRGRLGVGVQQMDPALAKSFGLEKPVGALVGDIEKGGPADRAGIRPGDVIVAVDNTKILHSSELPRIIARHPPGAKVKIEVVRNGQKRTFEATLDELKEEPQEGAEGGGGARPAPQMQGELGIGLSDAQGGGALVQRVSPTGSAADVLEPGDVILEVNHQHAENANDVANLVKNAPKNKPLLLRIRRQGHERFVAVERK